MVLAPGWVRRPPMSLSLSADSVVSLSEAPFSRELSPSCKASSAPAGRKQMARPQSQSASPRDLGGLHGSGRGLQTRTRVGRLGDGVPR